MRPNFAPVTAPASVEYHTAAATGERTRLQEYGIGCFRAAPTRSAWRKALKRGYVTVDRHVATTATWITGGEAIVITVPAPAEPRRKLLLPLAVLYEDDHLAVVRKPAGILVSGNGFKTVSAALPQNLQPSPLPDACRPWPVHRLDYPTTGVLLVGKTSSSIRDLNAAFEEKRVQKTYVAIVIGVPPASGTIITPIDGKPARSDYGVLASVSSERFGRLTLLRLEPETGRRHQLRKHLAGVGTPILGDQEYGREGLVLRGKGLYLHALRLRFVHPVAGEVVEVRDGELGKYTRIFPGGF